MVFVREVYVPVTMATPYQLHRSVRSVLLASPMELLQRARVETQCVNETVSLSQIFHPTDDQKFMVVQMMTDPETGTATVEFVVKRWFPPWLQRETIVYIAVALNNEHAEILTPLPDDVVLVDDTTSVATR